MPRSRALWIAAMESLSSCGPHAKAQSPPPMAHAPKPMGVRWRSELPSCFLFIVALDVWVRSEATTMRENDFEARTAGCCGRKGWRAGRFCLFRDPSPFDFAQVQDYGKNKGGKAEADSCAALGNDKKKKRGTNNDKSKYRGSSLRSE